MNIALFRILRGFCGLNQTGLGQLLGKSQSTIACYEIGTIEIPAKVAERMKELAKEIGITELDLMVLQQLVAESSKAQAVLKTKAGEQL
ncbi:hypothetical protein ACVNNN_20105 [Lysinibacillus fusiformis]|uniref:hypothetical protein n=1 Tax=Lysinibacillus sp. PWR01 TaxID=3342384 RepID=UPI00372CF76E